MISSRGSGLPYHMRSWRGRPERCVSRSRGVMRSPAKSSQRRKSGRYSRTGRSQSSLPSSTRVAREAAVKALVTDASGKRVCSVTGFRFSASRSPYPRQRMTFPSSIARPVRPQELTQPGDASRRQMGTHRLEIVIVLGTMIGGLEEQLDLGCHDVAAPGGSSPEGGGRHRERGAFARAPEIAVDLIEEELELVQIGLPDDDLMPGQVDPFPVPRQDLAIHDLEDLRSRKEGVDVMLMLAVDADFDVGMFTRLPAQEGIDRPAAAEVPGDRKIGEERDDRVEIVLGGSFGAQHPAG